MEARGLLGGSEEDGRNHGKSCFLYRLLQSKLSQTATIVFYVMVLPVRNSGRACLVILLLHVTLKEVFS